MKKLIVLFFLITQGFTQTQMDVVAILPFNCSGVNDTNISPIITELTQNALLKYSKIRIVEKSQVNKIIKELGFTQSGLTENIIETGKLLTAQKVIIGSLIQLNDKITISIRLVDTKTGEIINSEETTEKIQINDIDNSLINDIVEVLITGEEQYVNAKKDFANKNYSKAVENFEILVKKFPYSKHNSEALFLLGFINYYELNNKVIAKKYYEEFLEKYPDHPLVDDVKYELEQINKE